MPDAELRRQRTAYRRGLLRAAVIGAGVAMVMGISTLAAINKAGEARQARDQLRISNRQLQEKNRDLAAALNEARAQRRQAVAATRRESQQKRAALQAQAHATQLASQRRWALGARWHLPSRESGTSRAHNIRPPRRQSCSTA